MENFHKMESDLEKVIENDDASTVTSDFDETDRNGHKNFRQKLDHIIHSNSFMIAVVVLVILDCMMVIAELLFDLEIVRLGEEHKTIPKIFHYSSLAILSIFLLELGLRFYVLRLSFFKHKLEVFDAIVVIVSFILDIIFRNHEDASTGVGLLIVLRLWRVTRIVNGIVMSVKKQAKKKIEKERNLREICEKELGKFKEYCTAQEAEIEVLQGLLRKHNISFTVSPVKKPSSTASAKINVVVEVNRVVQQDSPQEEADQEASLDSGRN